ncbi:hypothetical protein MKQ68_14175 [Chitinophaga horti]|uniref:Uncharacterized protein n=1 Tax=Chitinophaga horti TaxID=2920382 RepID=A0ABY6IZ01_9BACT|nr:hypothetical protein [Chitinophaga horti]UYQ91239.1 hypothetical protein MKQ68_14175 [Chitinophaga horti]
MMQNWDMLFAGVVILMENDMKNENVDATPSIAGLRVTYNATKYGYTDEELLMIHNFLEHLCMLDVDIFLNSRVADRNDIENEFRKKHKKAA